MKAWYQSKTLWVNAIVAALAALEAGTGILQPFLPANFYAIVAVGLPVVNAILRIVTTQGLALAKSDA
jgi:hypothetical protein